MALTNQLFTTTILGLMTVMTLSTRVLSYDFYYREGESEIFNTDLDNSIGWEFDENSIEFNLGRMQAKSAWAKASYKINRVNLDVNDIFVYFSVIFPNYQGELNYAENNKMLVGTQYLENSDGIENAEIKMELRPTNPVNPGDRFHLSYVDPGFEESHNAEIKIDNASLVNVTDYRLQLYKSSVMDYQAISFFWNVTSNQWQEIATLEIEASDLINSIGEIDSPPTIEAVTVQFRMAGSKLDAIALTKQEAQVPEPLTLLGSATAFGFGAFFKRELAKKHQKNAEKNGN